MGIQRQHVNIYLHTSRVHTLGDDYVETRCTFGRACGKCNTRGNVSAVREHYDTYFAYRVLHLTSYVISEPCREPWYAGQDVKCSCFTFVDLFCGGCAR